MGKRKHIKKQPEMSERDQLHLQEFGTNHPIYDKISENHRVDLSKTKLKKPKLVTESVDTFAEDDVDINAYNDLLTDLGLTRSYRSAIKDTFENTNDIVESIEEYNDDKSERSGQFVEFMSWFNHIMSDEFKKEDSKKLHGLIGASVIDDDNVKLSYKYLDQFKESRITSFPDIEDFVDQKSSIMKHYLKLVTKTVNPKLNKLLLRSIFQYNDVCFSLSDGNLQAAYCAHSVYHVLRTRGVVLAGDQKVKNGEESLDQGFTRPKVLFLVPFRSVALRIAEMIIELIKPKNSNQITMSMNRLFTDYGIDSELEEVKMRKGDASWRKTFRGNIDDHFRLGINVSRRSLSLFAPYYQSDVIIASPLGLKTLVTGRKEKAINFLSSIEIMVIDQAEVILQQNWDHVISVINLINRIPSDPAHIDFSRVRHRYLDGHASNFRQTIVISQYPSSYFKSLIERCRNIRGALFIDRKLSEGSIRLLRFPLKQTFVCLSSKDRIDEFFTKIIEPYTGTHIRTIIYIPSFFDFVLIKNRMNDLRTNDLKFTFSILTEQCSSKDADRSRFRFFHNKTQFLLLTERYHFYRRHKIRGADQVVFYDLPNDPRFYADLCHMLDESATKQCIAAFERRDVTKLVNVLGQCLTAKIICNNDDREVYVIKSRS